MVILNRTRNTVLVKEFEEAKNIWKKTIGLMFRKNLHKDRGLLMVFNNETRTGIWMFGMRFPIDLVFIDKDKRIVDLREHIKPLSLKPNTWRVYYPKKPVKYILEANKGVIRKTNACIGDVLGF